MGLCPWEEGMGRVCGGQELTVELFATSPLLFPTLKLDMWGRVFRIYSQSPQGPFFPHWGAGAVGSVQKARQEVSRPLRKPLGVPIPASLPCCMGLTLLADK